MVLEREWCDFSPEIWPFEGVEGLKIWNATKNALSLHRQRKRKRREANETARGQRQLNTDLPPTWHKQQELLTT